MSDRFLMCFFIYYLAALRSALGHHQGDSFSNPMLITALRIDSNFDPKVTRSLLVRLGPYAQLSAKWGLIWDLPTWLQDL